MRKDGWEAALHAAIADAAPFAWGTRDCATWAFDIRRALTDIDAAAEWRGRYRSARGAARMLRRLGVTSVEALAGKIMGPPLSPRLAQRGDLVLSGEDDALGVCIGAHGLFLAPQGVTRRPILTCRAAWRV